MSLNLSENILTLTGVTQYGNYLKKVTRDGLVLELDAGDLNSYPGTGSSWYDLSGFDHDFTFGAGISWNSGGWFDCTTGEFSGPASNLSSWDLNSDVEHYIEAWVNMVTLSPKIFFIIAGNVTGALTLRLGYTDPTGLSYYDVGGTTTGTQRIFANITGLVGNINCISYHTRDNIFPGRRVYKNLVLNNDSGAYVGNQNVSWNSSTTVKLATNWIGKLYLFRMYNRPLHPYEMAENFQATRGRFGI